MATTSSSETQSSRRLAAVKRRISRDVLPDVTNLPEMPRESKVSRRQPISGRTTLKNSGQIPNDTKERVDDQPAGRHGNKGGGAGGGAQEAHCQPERAAKIAARAKILAAITPNGHARKRKHAFKAQTVQPDTVSLSLENKSEEPMEIDNPALTLHPFEPRMPDSVLDIDDHDDHLLCPEYAQEIMAYLQNREKKSVLPADYLNFNPEVTSMMRGVLVDWLLLVQSHEQLEDETLQLCVALTDQYLARAHVQLSQLQLVGITCMLIAAKYVERFPPMVAALCALTACTYKEAEVLEMEKHVLRILQFNLCLPQPVVFLRRFLQVHPHDAQVERLAHYLVDLALPSVHFVPVLPSTLAASALYVSRRVWVPEEPEPWSPGLAYYSGYSHYQQLAPSVAMLAKILLRAAVSKYQGARKKHSDKKFGAISHDPVLENHPALIDMAKDAQ